MTAARRFFTMVVAVLCAVAVLDTEPAAADPGAEADFASRLNGLRTSRGLAPLEFRGELSNVARPWSERMAAAGSLSHNGALSSQVPFAWSRVGEAVGTGGDVAGVFDAFVNSPFHLGAMLDPNFDVLGVGVVRNGAGQLFVTLDFVRTAAAPAAAPAPPAASAAPAPAPTTGYTAAPGKPKMVRKVVRECSRNRRGRLVCVRRVRLVRA